VRAVSLNHHHVIKVPNKNPNHNAGGTTRTKIQNVLWRQRVSDSPNRYMKNSDLDIKIHYTKNCEELYKEIITNVTDITEGKKMNNKRRGFLVINEYNNSIQDILI